MKEVREGNESRESGEKNVRRLHIGRHPDMRHMRNGECNQNIGKINTNVELYSHLHYDSQQK